jgi:hypothetical protein
VLLALAALSSAVALVLPVPAAAAGDGPAPGLRAPVEKVTICHRTNSRTNPYNQVAVAASGAVSGHADHTGPVFAPDVEDWGDIVPPTEPDLPRGLNWPEGRAILENGCEAEPDPGPLPAAAIGDVACVGTNPSVVVTVTNDAEATAPATFTILVDGVVVETVEAVPPGGSRTVTLGGAGLAVQENQVFTIVVQSGGEVIQARVVTADCAPGPPPVGIVAGLACADGAARATVTLTNNGAVPVEVTATVDGVAVGTAVVVGPGATEVGSADLSPYEDQTIDASVIVDGTVAATYTVTPNCVPAQASPRVRVAGQECPPPTTTVTLANTGAPDSRVVFVIRINGRIVQTSAPLYGGDSTTIVGDLARFEDRTVAVELRANGEVLGSRTIRVDCVQPAAAPDPAVAPDSVVGPDSAVPPPAAGPAALPSVGDDVSGNALALGLGLVAVGSLLVVASRRRGLRTQRR